MARHISVDDPLLDSQHPVERDGDRQWRWTRGELNLDPALWQGFRSHVILQLHIAPSGGTRWVAPASTGADGVRTMPYEAQVIAFARR